MSFPIRINAESVIFAVARKINFNELIFARFLGIGSKPATKLGYKALVFVVLIAVVSRSVGSNHNNELDCAFLKPIRVTAIGSKLIRSLNELHFGASCNVTTAKHGSSGQN